MTEDKSIAKQNMQVTLATGERSVALGGSVTDTLIVTGNNNIFSLNKQGAFSFHLLDEMFRVEQQHRTAAAFYDGTRPNWANIAQHDDSQRFLYNEIRGFIEDQQLHAQRMAIILGLAGEGKTTLLMRLAWDLAAAGFPVLWRHSGIAFATSARDLSVYSQPIVLCFDQADDDRDLPRLVADLGEYGVPFVILATSRHHEWRNAGLEPALRRSLYLQPFVLTRLTETEVSDLLERLSQAGKLGALANMPRPKQVQHFLDRLQADGQLLPALLTARRGATSFESIVEDVLQKIRQGPDGEFLVRAYVLLAAVHRFGYWLSRSLYAQALHVPAEEIGQRVLGPLEGELMEVNEAEGERLYTRHPVIADCVTHLAEIRHLAPETRYLYDALLDALSEPLRKNPSDPQRKLLSMLPVALTRIGDIAGARELFERGTRADPSNAPSWQAWACLEEKQDNIAQARELFERGTRADSTHAPVYQAWALLEQKQGNIAKARELFKRGTRADPNHAPVYQAWACLEQKQGNIAKARELFKRGTRADPNHAPVYQAWAILEQEQGNIAKAHELFERGTHADPTDAATWQAWGLLEQEQGNIAQARELYKRGTRADPTHASPYQAWALLEQEQGNIAKARELFERGTRADPTNAPTWQAWGRLEEKQDNIAKARELFKRGTRADPTNAYIWQAWALLEQKQRDITKARELFERGTRADPSDAPTWQAWALLEQKQGNIAEARKLFERGTRADPTDAYSWQPWVILELEHDPPRALQIVELALQRVHVRRGQATLMCTRARTYTKLQRFTEAEESFIESLRLDDGNSHIHYFYAADLLEPQDRREEACSHYRRALQLGSNKPREKQNIEQALRRLGCG